MRFIETILESKYKENGISGNRKDFNENCNKDPKCLRKTSIDQNKGEKYTKIFNKN